VTVRLDEYDKVEWFDVCRRLQPGLTWDEYEDIWRDYVEAQVGRPREACEHVVPQPRLLSVVSP
jgi:hypothetical protein